MQAIKLRAYVDRDRKLSLQLPAEVPESDVEVIVLAPARADVREGRRHLEKQLCKLTANLRARRFKAEIDADGVEKRASSDRTP